MTSSNNFYDVLNISKDASPGDIKKAYRKLAMKYHPDKNKGDKGAEEKFKEVTEAYAVLSDPQKKSTYDQVGHSAFTQGGGAGPGGFGGGGFDFNNFNMDDAFNIFGNAFGGGGGDIFDMFFGGGSKRGSRGSRKRKGEDIQIRLPLSLKEIASGAKKKLKYKKYVACQKCSGTGSKNGSSGGTTCSTCGGSGQVKRVQQSMFGNVVNVTTCPTCGGSGSVIKNKCSSCGGSGRTHQEIVVEVDIPAGVENDNYLVVKGKGHVGENNGPAGDLIVVISEKNDKIFTRKSNDLYCTLNIPYSLAFFGGDAHINTVDGSKIKIKIPAGIISGKMLKIRGKGLPSQQSSGYFSTSRTGDLYIKVNIAPPESSKIDSEYKNLLKELKKLDEKKGIKASIEKK